MTVKNVEKKEKSTAAFQVEIDRETFEKAVNDAYKRLKNQIFVQGFRKGKAPRVIIEGMYGADIFYDEAVQIIAPDAFKDGAKEAELEAIGTPTITDYNVDDDKVLTINFSTDVYPEVKLGQYRELEAAWSEPTVSDEDVNEEVERERKKSARYVDVDRAVKEGDTISLDFEGFVDGVAFEGGKGEDYSLEIGSGTFIPGFEDQLVGMEAGQEGEVHVTFPMEYEQSLAGKDATFKVKVNSVREPQLPELDDEFAKDVSEFDTLSEYMESVRERMLKNETEAAESDFKSELLNKAIENMEVELPESMIADALDDILMSYANNFGIPANTREELFSALGISEENFNMMMRPTAVRRTEANVLLDAVAKAENIEAADEDKEEIYKQLEEDYGENAERFKALINEELMVQDIVRRKAASIIYDTAKRTEPVEEEASEATDAAEEAAESAEEGKE